MAFRKTFENILSRMTGWFLSLSDAISDFTPGSVLRSIFEAVSAELEELYTTLEKAVEYAVRESLYQTFEINRLPYTYATAEVEVTFIPSHPVLSLPEGWKISTSNGLNFYALAPVSVDENQPSVTITMMAERGGAISNVPANSIRRMPIHHPFVLSVNNPSPSVGGLNEESEFHRRNRFVKFIHSLSKATKPSLRFALASIPEIQSIDIDEVLPGTVKIYISTLTGDYPESLSQKVSKAVEDYRAGGIQVIVSSVNKIEMEIDTLVDIAPGFSLPQYKEKIETTINNYLNSFVAGQNLILSHLVFIITQTDQYVIKRVEIKTPSEDVQVSNSHIIRAGNVWVDTRDSK